MTREQFSAVSDFREAFRAQVTEWSAYAETLAPLQKRASADDTPPYPLETSVVYNRALDDITPADEIKLIVIGDNPGKDEQRAINNRYLVGQSGKVADGFFRRNAALGIDFRKNVIILNKTPIHTAKTKHLRVLQKADAEIALLILESQRWMAERTARLHQVLCAAAFVADSRARQNKATQNDVTENAVTTDVVTIDNTTAGIVTESITTSHDAPRITRQNKATQLWLVGYAELKAGGIFAPYRDALKAAYKNAEPAWQNVFVFQHFSMNRFLIDLRDWQKNHAEQNLAESLASLGTRHRIEIFGE